MTIGATIKIVRVYFFFYNNDCGPGIIISLQLLHTRYIFLTTSRLRDGPIMSRSREWKVSIHIARLKLSHDEGQLSFVRSFVALTCETAPTPTLLLLFSFFLHARSRQRHNWRLELLHNEEIANKQTSRGRGSTDAISRFREVSFSRDSFSRAPFFLSLSFSPRFFSSRCRRRPGYNTCSIKRARLFESVRIVVPSVLKVLRLSLVTSACVNFSTTLRNCCLFNVLFSGMVQLRKRLIPDVKGIFFLSRRIKSTSGGTYFRNL